jgi:DNA mismatch repair protein MutS2
MELGSRAARDLGWSQILEGLAARSHTQLGAERARALAPLGGPQQALHQLEEIRELRRLWDRSAPIPFGGIVDIREAVARAAKHSPLDAEELLAVAQSGRGFSRLREHVEQRAEILPLVWERAAAIPDLEELHQPILDSFQEDGTLADDASPELGRLRRKVARLQQSLEQRARELIDDPRIASELQDRYWTLREDRYVLPIRSASRSRIQGIVHGASGSGQTVFVEPQPLVELNNALKLAEVEVDEEERRILAQLSQLVGEHADALRSAATLATEIDLLSAAARLANDLGAHPPELSSDGGFDLRRARHPLMLLAGKECVPNDIRLQRGTILVVSGPNAGGKTVALKTLGLAMMMFRHGLHIASGEGSSLPWCQKIFTTIGDAQSIESELSTFSAHLQLLTECLSHADSDSLVLIDELCAATEPEQGAMLAQAVLEALAERGVPTLVTTHYEPLKALGAEDSRFENAAVGFDLERLAPTFRLHLGVPGASAALDVARRLHFPEPVLARATELLGGQREIDTLLRVVADERERLADERVALEDERKATAEAYERAAQAEIEATERQREAHGREHASAIKALTDARLELDRARAAIRKSKRPAELKSAQRRIDSSAKSIREKAPREQAADVEPLSQADLVVGARVMVPKLGSRGTIVAIRDRGKVEVQLGMLKSTLSADELVADTQVQPVAAKKRQRREAAVSFQTVRTREAPVRSPDATLDIRGERVHDAERALDRFIDESLLAGREVIFVIHGHGTGALRQAVRALLEIHASVLEHRPGEPSEGGDGVTLAWLDT